MIQFRRSIALTAFALAFAVPAAFAQTGSPAAAPTGSQAAAVAPASPAGVAGDPAKGEKNWAQLDSNGDGNVSRDEAAADAMWSEHFANADANADGALSRAEFDQHHADMGYKRGDDMKDADPMRHPPMNDDPIDIDPAL